MSRPVAIVAGYLARYPLGGHLLSQYHFLAGLAKLGYEVVFVEHHGWSNACYDPRTNTMSDDPTYGLSQILPFFKSIGSRRWCYVDAAGKWHGLQRDDVRNLCRNAAFVASVSSTTWLDELRECNTRIFVDIDPGFTQFKMSPTPNTSCPGYASPYDFNFHFTFGERIGQPDCPVPTHGLRWQPIRQPLARELIQPRFTPQARRFTTVMSWTAYGSVEYRGVTYGQKNLEMLKFLDLPRRMGEVFEIALGGVGAPPTVAGRRLGRHRSAGGDRQRGRLPRLHRQLTRGIQRGQGRLREDPLWLVQRPHRRLSRFRQAGHRAGYRLP